MTDRFGDLIVADLNLAEWTKENTVENPDNDT